MSHVDALRWEGRKEGSRGRGKAGQNEKGPDGAGRRQAWQGWGDRASGLSQPGRYSIPLGTAGPSSLAKPWPP